MNNLIGRKIICAYCGESKLYPDNFPNINYAQCDLCIKEMHEKEFSIVKFIRKLRELLTNNG